MKPKWWPSDLRHTEPDHLKKPERIRLMLAILCSGQVELAKLEMASAEQAARLGEDKMGILRDMYTVVKEEERLRATQPGTPWHTSPNGSLLLDLLRHCR